MLTLRLTMIIGLLLMTSGCATAYYNTMEKFGVHKREILVDRVGDARDAQSKGQKQFSSALEQFKSVVEVDGGNLEKTYNKLNKEFERSEEAAEAIHERIDDIKSVASALFKEWNKELEQYSSSELRMESQQQLNETESRYRQLIAAMESTEMRLDPVLDAMRDQVLYLKHNLNARAVGALRDEVVKIDQDVTQLLEAMRRSIGEADDFIRDMKA